MGKFAIIKAPLLRKILNRLGPGSELSARFNKNKSKWAEIVGKFDDETMDDLLAKKLKSGERFALPASLFQEMTSAAKISLPAKKGRSVSDRVNQMQFVRTPSGWTAPKKANTQHNSRFSNRDKEYGSRTRTPDYGKNNWTNPNYVKEGGTWRKRRGQ
jgi:hypothetical protein